MYLWMLSAWKYNDCFLNTMPYMITLILTQVSENNVLRFHSQTIYQSFWMIWLCVVLNDIFGKIYAICTWNNTNYIVYKFISNIWYKYIFYTYIKFNAWLLNCIKLCTDYFNIHFNISFSHLTCQRRFSNHNLEMSRKYLQSFCLALCLIVAFFVVIKVLIMICGKFIPLSHDYLHHQNCHYYSIFCTFDKIYNYRIGKACIMTVIYTYLHAW